MLEVVVVAFVITGMLKAFNYQDTKKNIIIIAIVTGITNIFPTYCVSLVEALMAGSFLKAALIASFVSLPATVVNSISTAILTPILYFFVKKVYTSLRKNPNKSY